MCLQTTEGSSSSEPPGHQGKDCTRPPSLVQFLGEGNGSVGMRVKEREAVSIPADRVLVREARRTRHPRSRPCALSCVVALSLALLLIPLAWSTELVVVPVDGPSASATELHGITHTGQLVGTFWDVKGAHGLLCTPPLDAPCSQQSVSALDLWFNGVKAVSTQIQSITTGGRLAGFFADGKGASHGFLCTGFPANLDCHQVDVTIDSVVMANTLILGIDEQGQFVGSYRDVQSRIHGYLYADGSFSRIDVPGALATVVSGITTTSGKTIRIVGFFVDMKLASHGFLCVLPVSQHCFTIFDVTLNGVPQAMTQATGITQQELVGSFRDPGGQAHGFLCVLPITSACFTQLDVRDGAHTEILGVNDRGQLVGRFRDPTGLQHGFTTMAPSVGSAGQLP